MTRLFPRPLDDLPRLSRDDPRKPTNLAVAAPAYAGGAGILLSPLILLHRRFATLPVKVAAYCCPVLVIAGYAFDKALQLPIDTYLEAKGIERTKREFFDQTDRFGLDDAGILGAAAGLLIADGRVIANGRKILPRIKGWRRYFGQASLGAGTGELSYGCYWTLRNQEYLWERAEERKATKADREKLLYGIFSTFKRSSSIQKAHHIQQPAPADLQAFQAPPDMLARTQPDPASMVAELSPSSLGLDQLAPFNENAGPHVTGPEPGESEPKPIPATNYDWAVSQERILPELEAHISSLRAHRKKLSEQATFLWHWLAEKEGEYYRLRNDPKSIGFDAEQSKDKAKEYCKALSFEHVALWMAVGKIDWMIADSQKRIAQHKAQPHHSPKEDTPPAYVTWLPNSSPPTVREPPEFVLWRLRQQQQQFEQMLQVLDKTNEGLKHDVDDPKMPNMPPQARAVLSKHPQRRQEVQRLLREGQEQRAKAVIMKEATEEVIRDGELKAGRNDKAEGP